MNLTHVSLFSGIGGADIAAEWAGFTTVGQVEWADYPTRVLEKHWPNVPRWRDICEFGVEELRNGTGLSTVDIISGGFPCQPFSKAGKRKGADDDRYLWPQMLRVISEIKPTWVIGENVAGIVSMALDQVQSDLESQGYSTQSFIIPAAGVNAPHRRERVFIVAHSNSIRHIHGELKKQSTKKREQTFSELGASGDNVANASSKQGVPGNYRRKQREVSEQKQGEFGGSNSRELRQSNWTTEPELDRVVDGIPNRVDRLRCLGNAIVPQQIYPIFKAIAEIETEAHHD